MTDRLDLGARLSRFLAAEAPPRAPERLIHATRDHIAGTRQRRGLGGLRWRIPDTTLGRVAAAGGVLAVAMVATVLVLSNRSGSIGSTSSPSPGISSSAQPSPSPFACPPGQGTCLGVLLPGRYSSTTFVPAVSYTVPAGWVNTTDIQGELDLRWSAGGQYHYPDGSVWYDGISIVRRPVAESSTTQTPAAGVGKTANDLAQWLAAHVDLNASTPVPVTIGGASGFRLVLSVPTGTRTAPDHCTTDHGEPRCVSLFLSDDPAATFGFGLVGPEIAVVDLLDLPSGDTVMVVIDDVDGINQPALEAAATPVVNSLAFSP